MQNACLILSSAFLHQNRPNKRHFLSLVPGSSLPACVCEWAAPPFGASFQSLVPTSPRGSDAVWAAAGTDVESRASFNVTHTQGNRQACAPLSWVGLENTECGGQWTWAMGSGPESHLPRLRAYPQEHEHLNPTFLACKMGRIVTWTE